MAITLTVGGQIYSPVPNSVGINQRLGGRDTADFVLRLPNNGATPPSVGREVVILDGPVKVFGGQINDVDRVVLSGQQWIDYRYNCNDYTQILDRRLAGERSWIQTSAGQIVQDVIDNVLAADGFSSIHVEVGPIVERFEIFYPTVSEVISRLAELVDFQWFVDYEKNVRFFSSSSYSCPFAITSTPDTNNCRNLVIRPTREQLVNRVVVHLGQYVLDARTEVFNADGRHGGDPDPDEDQRIDGTRKTFSVTFPIHAQPTVKVNDINQLIGIRGVDVDRSWYWNVGNRDIEQDDSADVLTASDTLEITYSGLSETTVTAQNDASIAERIAVEGGAGIYEELLESSSPLTKVEGQQWAQGVVNRRASLSYVAKFEADVIIEPNIRGAKVGQSIVIARSGYAADGEYLIRSIQVSDHRGRNELRYEIEAVKGPLTEDAVEFFRTLGNTAAGTITTSGNPGPDWGTPPEPHFGISAPGNGKFEFAIGFPTLENTKAVSSATFTVFYVDETLPRVTILDGDISASDGTLTGEDLTGLSPDNLVLIDTEVVRIISISGPTATIERAQKKSIATAHLAGASIWRVVAKTFFYYFPSFFFFGHSGAGDWSPIEDFPSKGIVAAELFVTNLRGNSKTFAVNYSSIIVDGRLRTLTGRQVRMSVDGVIGVESDVVPPIVLPEVSSFRDIFAEVASPPVGGSIVVDLRIDGTSFTTLTIAEGELLSDVVRAVDLGFPVIPGDVPITFDTITVGGTFPGERLTVTIRQ